MNYQSCLKFKKYSFSDYSFKNINLPFFNLAIIAPTANYMVKARMLQKKLLELQKQNALVLADFCNDMPKFVKEI